MELVKQEHVHQCIEQELLIVQMAKKQYTLVQVDGLNIMLMEANAIN
jgi:hypothetical protein